MKVKTWPFPHSLAEKANKSKQAIMVQHDEGHLPMGVSTALWVDK